LCRLNSNTIRDGDKSLKKGGYNMQSTTLLLIATMTLSAATLAAPARAQDRQARGPNVLYAGATV
jgi:hypothetical protein